MFLSVNKKIIYSISLLLVITNVIFAYSFYNIYLKQFLNQKEMSLIKDNQNISTTYENILLKSELLDIFKKNDIKYSDNIKNIMVSSKNLEERRKDLELERLKTQNILKNYDDKYSTMEEAFNVFLASGFLIFFFIFLMWMFLNRWVVKPLDKLSEFSHLVSENLFSLRLEMPKNKVFNDEFYYLYKTFNKMLDNIENSISEIKSKEEYLQALIDNIPDGIRVIDEKFNIITINKQYLKQIDNEDNQIMRKCYKSSQNFCKPCPRSAITCPVFEIINNKVETTKTIQQFANKPNNRLYINSAPLNITKDNQEQKLIVQVIRDLSEDIKFSHQQKLSSIGFLATAVAHEMKNNLGSVRIITEGLLERINKNKTNDAEIKEFLTMINTQIIESINVPERLLKLSRMPNNNLEILNCYESVVDIVKLLDYEAKSKGLKINIDDCDKELQVRGTSGEFKIIIINLLQNALNAVDKNGKIAISIKKKNQKVIIEVIDNGKGIATKDIKYIFDPFYSEGNTTEKKGTGLGLPIVKSIVDKFEGKIKATSKKNIGTTFTMYFPLIKKSLHN